MGQQLAAVFENREGILSEPERLEELFFPFVALPSREEGVRQVLPEGGGVGGGLDRPAKEEDGIGGPPRSGHDAPERVDEAGVGRGLPSRDLATEKRFRLLRLPLAEEPLHGGEGGRSQRRGGGGPERREEKQ
jgi:hypothetical protein